MTLIRAIRWLLLSMIALGMMPALASDREIALAIENHHFHPEVVEAPAGERFVLVVTNRDATPEEFESLPLHREKIILGGATSRIKLGPLSPGDYPFFGEFHAETAKGILRIIEKKGDNPS